MLAKRKLLDLRKPPAAQRRRRPQPAPHFWAPAAPALLELTCSCSQGPHGREELSALLANAALSAVVHHLLHRPALVPPANSTWAARPPFCFLLLEKKLAEIAGRNRLNVYFNFPGLQWSEVLPAQAFLQWSGLFNLSV